MKRTIAVSLFSSLALLSIAASLASYSLGSEEGNVVVQVAGKEASGNSRPAMPMVNEPAANPDIVRKAYGFVADRPEVTQYIPCFCNYCKMEKHQSIEDCYVRSRAKTGSVTKWNDHAAECFVCLSVAVDAQTYYLQGKNLSWIRNQIEVSFGPKYKNHTPTPEPLTKEHE